MSNSQRESDLRPLYIDLDGSLVSTDTLWESLCLLIRSHFWRVWVLLIHLSKGKAHFKSFVAGSVQPDASLLPYCSSVVALAKEAKASGRRVVLATASHESIARGVAEHLGFFDEVLASGDDHNLRSEAKLQAIRRDCGEGDFDYVGNDWVDFAIWREAKRAYVVGGSKRLRRRLAAEHNDIEALPLNEGTNGLPALRRAIRPYQWAKNVLVFTPIVLAQQVFDWDRLIATSLAFVAFCAVASAGYLVNDMLDIEGDRRHPTKRNRPLAAGRLGIPEALMATAALLAVGAVIALAFVSVGFLGMLLLYLMMTLAYSLVLKEMLFLDVLILASLYTHRVVSGGVAASVDVSPWLLAFSVFFFMSLAMLKRYVELLQKNASGHALDERIDRRAYSASDVGLVQTMGVTSGYISVLVLGLYTSRDEVSRYYSFPDLLWLVLPLMIYWVSRIWFLAGRGQMPDDPVAFAMKDRNSYVVFAGIALVGLLAATVGPFE